MKIIQPLRNSFKINEDKGYVGPRFYTASRKDVQGQLKAIGANVLFRGHQGSLFKLEKNNSNIFQ